MANGWGGRREGAGGVAPKNPNPPRGSNAHFAKLTEDDVRLIRELYADGMSSYEIAEKFEVTQGAAYRAATYKSWWHVQ